MEGSKAAAELRFKAPRLCHHLPLPPRSASFQPTASMSGLIAQPPPLSLPPSERTQKHTEYTHLFLSAFPQRSLKDKNLILCLLVSKCIEIVLIKGSDVDMTFGIYLLFFIL